MAIPEAACVAGRRCRPRAPAAPAPRQGSTDRPGRMSSRRLGPAAHGAVAVAYATLWLVARPAGQPAGRFIGELWGAEAVLLFSCSLVMATLLPFIERAFGGWTGAFT